MPVQINQLRFAGTGMPIKPNLKYLRVIREPSARGILQSGVESIREFRQINRIKSIPTTRDLCQSYLKTIGKVIFRSKVDLTCIIHKIYIFCE